MSEMTKKIKMLKELSVSNDIKILCDILLDLVSDDKEPMGFVAKEKKNG